MNPVELSIVIPTHNRARALAACLESIGRMNFPKDRFEIIVVDNASTDDTAAVVSRFKESWPGRVTYVYEGRPGPSHARNAGIAASRGAIVGFIDDDVIVDPGWANAVLNAFTAEDIGGVEGRTIAFEAGPVRGFRKEVRNEAGGRYLTCNIAYQRRVLEEVGGFDPRYVVGRGIYCSEDTDLALAVLGRGYRIVFEPGAQVSHPVTGVGLRHFLRDGPLGRLQALLMRKHRNYWRDYGGMELFSKHGLVYFALLAVSIAGAAMTRPLVWGAALLGLVLLNLAYVHARGKGSRAGFAVRLGLFAWMFVAPLWRLVNVVYGLFEFRGVKAVSEGALRTRGSEERLKQ